MKTLRSLILAGSAGAALAYFFDPDRGRSRRVRARDRLAGKIRHGIRQGERVQRRTAAKVYGISKKIEHAGNGHHRDEMLDDGTLCDKIRSEVMGSRFIPKGRINISCEDGIAVLRGECDSPSDIRRVERAVLRVGGVRGVENLLHLTNTPAPNKAEALRASM